ncbi:MAG: class IV adenylate cyclase [Melioribacteraceae bacterium]|nr:class IV adenylate cyclase [Melioribacteraceae bacterium]MCF8393314.1 class IV adenylate cyclase [Melioribacteraceae bacterium]MCF8419166.1 class IV adenylate cyclase [Melioribacteraceae bacterium]
MPTNLELKIKIDNQENLYKQIEKIDAAFVKSIHQRDIYFKHDCGLLKLRVQDENAELIYYDRNETGDRFSNYSILLVDKKNGEEFLSNILTVEIIVEKLRKLYMYKNTRIHIDEVKNLGLFMEFETLVLTSKEEAEAEFNELVKLLNVDLNNQIRSSYRNLLTQK